MQRLLCVLGLLWALSAVACATPEQKAQYAENPEFLPAYTYEDGECFLETASLGVEDYSPPRYQISGMTHFVPAQGAMISIRHMTFRYNYDTQNIFLKGTDGKWYWLDPAENPISLCQVQLADLMFQLCYQIPFIH